MPNWVFDTVSRTWVEADKGSFTCDKASGYYLSPKYFFDKRIGWYEIIPASEAANMPDYFITAPNVIHTALGDIVVGSKDYQVAKAMGLLGDSSNGGILLGSTGAGSNNSATEGNASASWFDMTNLVNVINTLQSNATTGNVTAASNTQAGDAVTGAASVIANLVNLLTSAWSWSNGNLNFFFQNIFNPVNGDIRLNFAENATGGGGQLGTTANVNGTGAGSNNVVGVDNANTLNVNAQDNGSIVNNVDLNALSGDATATKNTGVGNVATGAALAEINIINLINSYISSGSSFFGVLNIFSSLNGDILFPEGFLNGMVPSGGSAANVGIGGTGANSNNTVGLDNSGSTNVNAATANTVNNNIQTNAASGSANLDANTVAGSASTGEAKTNSSLFNMTGQSIFGDNAVLVIVNVMGRWVGKFMNVAGGSTGSALLTGNATVGVNDTGANSNNQVGVDNSTNTNANLASNGTITNNVNVNAQSGDATAEKNTSVGDVSTGDAHAASNVANIFNSVLNVKHWFGVLVINVLGEWVGDVNHDSEAGGVAGGKGSAGAQAAQVAAPATVAGTEVPRVGLLALVTPAVSGGSTAGVAQTAANGGKVLTAAAQSPAQTAATTASKNMSLLFMISAIVMLLAGALAAVDKKMKRG